MKRALPSALLAATLLAAFAAPVSAQANKPPQSNMPPLQAGSVARPSDPTANKPSESGAQTNMPSGAATGAGQPQGAAQPPQAQSADSAKAKASKSGKRSKLARADKKRKHRASTRNKARSRTGDAVVR